MSINEDSSTKPSQFTPEQKAELLRRAKELGLDTTERPINPNFAQKIIQASTGEGGVVFHDTADKTEADFIAFLKSLHSHSEFGAHDLNECAMTIVKPTSIFV